MSKKIKEGSRVVIYRTPVRSFAASMQDTARDLKGRMDTVLSVRNGKNCLLASGWSVSKMYLKVVVS